MITYSLSFKKIFTSTSIMDKKTYEYIAQITNNTITERQICPRSKEHFPIFQKDREMLHKLSPTINGQCYELPIPTHAPIIRMSQRLAVRNNRYLYRRICDLTKQPIIALYSPEKPYKVYSHTARYSDHRNALSYGRPYNQTQSFFQQFHDLQLLIPRIATYSDNSSINCDYATGVTDAKNCYLSDTCSRNENIRYCSRIVYCSQIIDCYKCSYLEHCYACVLCQHGNQLQYCINCHDCSSCWYSSDLQGCHHCFGCHNLTNRSYCINNKQLTKERYNEFTQAQAFGSYKWRTEQYKTFMDKVRANTIHPATNIINSEQCIGNDIVDSHNCFLCYGVSSAQSCRYCTDLAPTINDCLDSSYSGHD